MKTELKEQIIKYSHKAYERGLVGGTGGNFSVRINSNKMLITATGVSLGDTNQDNLITVDLMNGTWNQIDGHKPSKEYLYHADILRIRPEVGAVLHVHPPYATTYGVMKRDIPMVTDAAFKQKQIPRVPFAPSGSEELRKYVVEGIEHHPESSVLLLEQHGIVALGKDIVAAYNMADLIEELARIAYFVENCKSI